MTKKPSTKPDDPEQYRRFLEAAKVAETDEDPEAFEKAFRTVAQKPPAGGKKQQSN